MMLTSASTAWLSQKEGFSSQTEGPHTWMRSRGSPRAHAPYAGSGVGEEQELATHVETTVQPLRRQHFCPGMGSISLGTSRAAESGGCKASWAHHPKEHQSLYCPG